MENHQSGNARIRASAQSSLACSSFTSSVSVPVVNASPEAAAGSGLALLRTGDRVRVDLSRSRVTATKAGVTDSIRVSDFSGLTVAAKRADVIGTERNDRIYVAACRTTICSRPSPRPRPIARESMSWKPPAAPSARTTC